VRRDGGLRAEVDEMLAADGAEHALEIERLIQDADGPSPDPDPFVGIRLGPWRVVDVLGHGGMGTVYLAERDDGQMRTTGRAEAGEGPGASGRLLRFTAESHILARSRIPTSPA
jgi:serine/threonine-protein kinase